MHGLDPAVKGLCNRMASADTMTSISNPGKYTAPAAACAADVLIALARNGTAMSIAQLIDHIGCTKSLAYRVLVELENRDLVARDAAGKYWLGVVAVELGGMFTASVPMMASIRLRLRKLAESTGETVNLGVLRGDHVLYLAREEGARSILAVSHTGKLLPANALGMGKALLAELPDAEVKARFAEDGTRPIRLEALTSRTITTMSELLDALAVTRARGYADDLHETVLGQGCVAVAVPLGLKQLETVGISISMSEERMAVFEDDAVEELLKARNSLIRESQAREAIGEPEPPGTLAAGDLY
jgi:DNA-binding IclR family transcriptional regulator